MTKSITFETACAEALAEIAASPVYSFSPEWNTKDVREFRLPYGCVTSALLLRHPMTNQPYVSEWGRLEVPPGLRGHKLGRRLVSAMAYSVLEQGATSMAGPVESQYTIQIHEELFGCDRLSFADTDPYDEEVIQLPITPAQAILSLERAEKFERDLEHREIGFDVMYVDLEGIDRSTLEQPRFLDVPIPI